MTVVQLVALLLVGVAAANAETCEETVAGLIRGYCLACEKQPGDKRSAVLAYPEDDAPLPIKRAPLPLKRSPLPLKRSPLPLKRSPLPLKRRPLPLKRRPLPLKRSFLPLKRRPLPIKREPLPLKRRPLPIKRAPLPIKRDIWFVEPENVRTKRSYERGSEIAELGELAELCCGSGCTVSDVYNFCCV